MDEKDMETKALRGVNLAGWLRLESWVTPDLFADSGALEEDSLVRALEPKVYAELVKEHRESFITLADFERLAARGLNAVRIEVPWYVFGGRGPATSGRIGCIEHVDAALDWAGQTDVKVLLAVIPDTEFVSLVADASSNSPVTARRREEHLRVISSLAKRYRDNEAFLGIELGDEIKARKRKFLTYTEGIPLHVIRNYYREGYEAVRRVAGTRPVVVIPDAGEPGAWKNFMAHDRYENVWLDIHPYRIVNDETTAAPTSTRVVMGRIREGLTQAKRSKLPVMAGKWSASLPLADSSLTPEGRRALERLFTSQQLAAYEGCKAWFFHTWKTATRLSGWDARIALSSFERSLLS